MKVADAVAVAGHEVHVCRYREARTLLRWLGEDLRGLRVLDVAGGDGYWAGRARGRGARAVALDLADAKLRYGRQLGARPLDEMARVLAPGGELVMSADALTLAENWPRLYQAHCERYHVQRTYSHAELAALLAARGLDVIAHQYQFRSRWAQRMYLGLSAHGGKFGFNAAAPATPLVAASDRAAHGDGGAIVLVRARRAGPPSARSQKVRRPPAAGQGGNC